MRAELLAVVVLVACTDGGRTAVEAVPVVTEGPVSLRGSCDGARPLGPITNYRHVIEVEGDAGYVRARADPSWSEGDHGNVLGELVAPQRVPAFGPVKGVPSNGIGWIVPLVDDEGHTCRGYVSATVAEAVQCDRVTEPLVGFPEPIDVMPGSCRPSHQRP